MEEDEIKKLINKEKADEKNIVIENYGGLFSNIHNIPEGFTYTIIDWNRLKDGD